MMSDEPFVDVSPTPDFQWPPEEPAGHIAGLERWPRPLAGVRIDGEYLRLEYRKPYVEGRGPFELATADFKMLADFANLADGDPVTDGRLLSFASHYGALGLCKKHGWPFAHTRPHCASDSEPNGEGQHRRERTGAWLFFSRLARAVVVTFTTKAKDERQAALAELREFIAHNQGAAGPHTAWEPYRIILHWLASSEFKVSFRNSPARLALYGVPPLWTALGMGMAMLAVGAKGLALCSACARLDTVKKPGRPGNRSYCGECRKRARVRDSTRDLRSRQRSVKDLRSQGRSVTEIARELGIGKEQVKRYLTKEQ